MQKCGKAVWVLLRVPGMRLPDGCKYPVKVKPGGDGECKGPVGDVLWQSRRQGMQCEMQWGMLGDGNGKGDVVWGVRW